MILSESRNQKGFQLAPQTPRRHPGSHSFFCVADCQTQDVADQLHAVRPASGFGGVGRRGGGLFMCVCGMCLGGGWGRWGC